MKTYGGLYEKIIDKENIRKAIKKASLGKRHKASVKRVLYNIDNYVEKLHEVLSKMTWRPVHIHNTKEINDGVELKKRIIVCPNFASEQCVHHAIMNVCEPLFRKKFYEYSCGSVKGKGSDKIKNYIKKITTSDPKHCKYVVKLDIKKFFQNAKPSFIFHEIRKTIRDKQVLRLFSLILRANTQVIDGKLIKTGIPIGFYTSPLFANVLLNPLDHLVKEKLGIEFYARYMDDIIMFSSNKRKLKKVCLEISNWLADRKLTLKPIWQVHKFTSINFIGYQFKKDGKVKLRDRIFIKSVRCIRRVVKKVKQKKLTVHDCLRVLSYLGRFKSADTYNAFRKYIAGTIHLKELRCRTSKYYKKLAKSRKSNKKLDLMLCNL